MRLFISIFSTFILLFIFTANAFAQSSWVINEFASDITIQNDGVVKITEIINADFGELEKHGIFRDLPYIYDGGDQKVYTELDNFQVFRNGNEEKFEEIKNGASLRLKIGDANKTISGPQTYSITYEAKGILKNYGSYDELYWDSTGNDWEVQIEKTTTRVRLPFEGIQQVTCFEGNRGSTQECANMSNDLTGAQFESEILYPGQGQTVVVGYDPGIIPILTILPPKSTWERITNPYSLLAFLVTFVLGNFFVVRKWWTTGRDRFFRARYVFDNKAKEETKPLFHKDTIVVEYTPPEKLRPAELGVLQDEKADTKDITATIIDLASRGYMNIEEIQKKWLFGNHDYKLVRKKTDTSELLNYEQLLFDKLFSHATNGEVKISELKQKFYSDLAKIKEQLYEDMVKKKFFPSDPEKVRLKYAGIAIFVLIGSISLAVMSVSKIPEVFDVFVATASAGLLLLLLSGFMSRRTAEGQEMNRRLQGYELFISQVEKHKQKFLEDKNIITQILPYTIIFGLTEKFAESLKEIGIKPPSPTWYHSARPFVYSDFSKSMNTFSSSMSSSISSSPRSSGFSGGGSSGGGFGGGGGGSW